MEYTLSRDSAWDSHPPGVKTNQQLTIKTLLVMVHLVRCGGGEGCCGHRSF